VASGRDVAAANTADDVPSTIGVPTISGVTAVVFGVPGVLPFLLLTDSLLLLPYLL
jgi:hypothetical protein